MRPGGHRWWTVPLMGAGAALALVAAAASATGQSASRSATREPAARPSAERARSPSAGAEVATGEPLRARLDVLDKTEAILRDKIEHRSGELSHRVRTLYKLTQNSWAPLWLEGRGRAALVRRRAFAGRLLARDVRELSILRDELASVERNRHRYEAAPTTAMAPAPRSLARPVEGRVVSDFGRYVGRRTGTALMSRGIELASSRGQAVIAPAGGTVAYAGNLRGLHNVVVVRHTGDVLSVVGKLASTSVVAGELVAAGDEIGTASGGRVYLEVRVGAGPGGLPVDPEPLLAR